MELHINRGLERARPYGAAERAILSVARGREALAAIRQWPGYRPTPLRPLAGFATAASVAEVVYKDEGERFGLGSFKALGGAYAVQRLVMARGTAGLVVTCATDGNHGRAVAWGAQRAGCEAVIYVHEGVSRGRTEAIAGYGARVRREGRTYDESVRICAAAAARNGWCVVSDTSWPGYEDVPKLVMQGYAVLAAEAIEQGARPSHVFLQGGVGGMAASVLAWLWETQGAARPVTVVVEPEAAACLLASAKAGRPTGLGGNLDTIMAGLACGEPSLVAWPILDKGADAFMSIPDAAAAETMRALADAGLVGGESGVAGLAGFCNVARDAVTRSMLGIDAGSRILCIGTEGATDAEVYRRIVGRAPEQVVVGRTP